ncbi:hypothetical protein ACLKA7_005443 [Drosophila subpalustris]
MIALLRQRIWLLHRKTWRSQPNLLGQCDQLRGDQQPAKGAAGGVREAADQSAVVRSGERNGVVLHSPESASFQRELSANSVATVWQLFGPRNLAGRPSLPKLLTQPPGPLL